MPVLEVYPRETPEERAEALVEVEVDEDLSVLAAVLEDWAAPRADWELTFRQGHDFGRANNVEVELMHIAGEQTAALRFRLDQLDAADDVGDELVLRFEESEGIAKLARLSANGLHVELFHVLTYT